MTLRPVLVNMPADGTHAAANPRGTPKEPPQVLLTSVSGELSLSVTSSAKPTRFWNSRYVHESEATTSGLTREGHAEITRKAISELRRISGLVWEQLGELFNVSRRSVHFWASGEPMNTSNEQRLMKVLNVVRVADRGDARSTYAALFEVHDGKTAFALLKAARFEEARGVLGTGIMRTRPVLAELSAAAQVARKPFPPEDLVEARHDRVHRNLGRSRAARTVRSKRRETD